ncbi:hypothetical protein WDV93_14545 [Pantoea ananatis]
MRCVLITLYQPRNYDGNLRLVAGESAAFVTGEGQRLTQLDWHLSWAVRSVTSRHPMRA